MPFCRPAPKKRGAPLGNKNALRHGAYARRTPPLPPVEAPSPTAPADPPPPSEDENRRYPLSLNLDIATLRAWYFYYALAGAAARKPEEAAVFVRTLSIAATAITRLIQTQNYLYRLPQDQVPLNLIDDVLDVFNADLKKSNTVPPPPPVIELSVPGILADIKALSQQMGIPESELTGGARSPFGPYPADPEMRLPYR